MAGMDSVFGARYQVHGADGQLSAVIYANWCRRQRTSEGISLSRSISLHSAGCGPTSFTKSASAYGSKSLSFTRSCLSKLAACLRGTAFVAAVRGCGQPRTPQILANSSPLFWSTADIHGNIIIACSRPKPGFDSRRRRNTCALTTNGMIPAVG